jgi:hypothetical protein
LQTFRARKSQYIHNEYLQYMYHTADNKSQMKPKDKSKQISIAKLMAQHESIKSPCLDPVGANGSVF